MRRLLQILALILALGSTAYWLKAGANRGWTKNSVPIKTVDEITGIEAITYEDRFVPGVDFLGGALLASGLVGTSSLFFRKRKQPN